jgi:ribosomal protein L37E
MALTLMTICSNCGEEYFTELLPSEKILPEVETYCSKCGFPNIDKLIEE